MTGAAGKTIVNPVPYELARRLLASHGMTEQQAHAALAMHVKHSVSLVRAFRDSGVSLEAIDRECRRSNAPTLHHIMPAMDVLYQLPEGLCEGLLAVPVRRDPMTGTIDVATPDPFGDHIRQEFAHHLQAPIRIVYSPLLVVENALEQIKALRKNRERPSASDIPIPLVRRSRAPKMGNQPRTKDIYNPPEPIVLSPGSLPATRLQTSDWQDNRIDPPTVESFHIAIPPSAALPTIEGVSAPFQLEESVAQIEAVLEELQQAATRDQVVRAALRAMEAVAHRVGIFAVRNDVFSGWACTPSFASVDAFKTIRVDRHRDTVLSHAALHGWYFGTVPTDAAHQWLADIAPPAGSEIAIVAVRILGRAAMLIVAMELFDSLMATRTAEQVAHATSSALLRVLRSEKWKDR